MKTYLKWNDVLYRINRLASQIRYDTMTKDFVRVWGIPRGGSIVSGLMCTILSHIQIVDDIDNCDIIVDDIYDSGATEQRYSMYNKPIYFLVDKRKEFQNDWVVFPWELDDEEKEVGDYLLRVMQYFNWDKNKVTDIINNISTEDVEKTVKHLNLLDILKNA